MSKHYFVKELYGSGFMINGARVPFEVLDGDQAVLALDDAIPQEKIFIDGLLSVIDKYTIHKITEGEYSEKKTLHPYNEQKQQLKARENLLQLHQSAVDKPNPMSRNEGVAAVSLTQQAKEQMAAEMTAPVPLADGLSEAFKPATGRPRGRPPKVAVA